MFLDTSSDSQDFSQDRVSAASPPVIMVTVASAEDKLNEENFVKLQKQDSSSSSDSDESSSSESDVVDTSKITNGML